MSLYFRQCRYCHEATHCRAAVDLRAGLHSCRRWSDDCHCRCRLPTWICANTTAVFYELSTLLEQLSTYQSPVYIVCDFNIHLDRPDDPHSVQFHLLVDCYSLMLHVQTAATHQLGGTLDAVITREDVGCPDRVEVVDVGLSDHHLLQWSVDTTRPEVPAVVELRRSWRRLDIDQFRYMLTSSSLCQPDNWPSDLGDMVAMYDHELNVLLEQLIPARSITCRRRPTDPWFDAECRTAKRLTRRLERACRRPSTSRHQRRTYGRQQCHICRRRLRCWF